MNTLYLVYNCIKISIFYRMKKKYYSWDECLNLREVKVSYDTLSDINCN